MLRAIAAAALVASYLVAFAGVDPPAATAAATPDPVGATPDPVIAPDTAGSTPDPVTAPDQNTAPDPNGAVAALGAVGALAAPAAPVDVAAEPLDGAARVSFALPAGSDAATSFEVTPSVGGAPVSGAQSPIVVSGLTNGVEVTFTVTATNDSGTSPSSDPSAAVTPTAVPSTTPTITAPIAAASVEGVVSITATSTAGAVRFTAGGVDLGAPVPTSAGSAGADWTSWGFANGTQTITAFDCNTTDPVTCSATPSSLDVTLANADPVITAPTRNVLTSGTTPLRATAPGGGISLEIDGTRQALDTSAPYAKTASLEGLADGKHHAQARSCDIAGTRCDGPLSASVMFRVKSLHPTIASAAPNPFSPNGDGVKDSVKVGLTLPDPESANWRVVNGAEETIRGPISLGSLSTGSHPFTWNGKNSNGQRVPNGTYRIVVRTTKQGTAVRLRGTVEKTVVVDTTKPSLTNVTGSGGTFYPGGGGSPAKFTAGATLGERVMLTMTVRKPSGALVRQPYGKRGPGAATIQWNGRDTKGRWAASGTYNWWVRATDTAGNSRTLGKYTVTMVRYASRTATFTLGGGAYSSLGANNSSCSYISRADSDFATGLWLLNDCDAAQTGINLVQANYAVHVPAALRYDTITIAVAGYTINPPSEIYGVVIKPNGDTALAGLAVAPLANSWVGLGSHKAGGYVNQARRLRFGVGVSNSFGAPSDVDLNSVQVKVKYTVIV